MRNTRPSLVPIKQKAQLDPLLKLILLLTLNFYSEKQESRKSSVIRKDWSIYSSKTMHPVKFVCFFIYLPPHELAVQANTSEGDIEGLHCSLVAIY